MVGINILLSVEPYVTSVRRYAMQEVPVDTYTASQDQAPEF